MAILPPNVSASEFSKAVTELSALLGSEWVFTSEDDIRLYRDPYSTVQGTELERSICGAVAPASVEEVQGIVRLANRYKIPLYSISGGKNYGYGGASPNLAGSMVVDLKRMDKVLEVDGDRNFALVEPGVTYFDLYNHIQERNLKVWIDCPSPGWGSVMGNALDRGIGYTMPFYANHIGASCGMEVVLPNGEIMRTGMGAMPGAQTWQEYPYGFGPDPAGLFAQGNFGIVTKMGFRLMPQPEHYRNGMITVPLRHDLIEMIKIANYLADSGMTGQPLYTSPLMTLMGDNSFKAALAKPGGPSDAELDSFATKHKVHSWGMVLQFYGPEATTLANWEYAKQRFKDAIPGAVAYEGDSLKIPMTEEQLFQEKSPFPYYVSHLRRKNSQGVPSLGIWKQVGRNARDPEGKFDGHAGFLPMIPRRGEDVLEAHRVYANAMTKFDVPGFGDVIRPPAALYPFVYQMAFVPPVSSTDQALNARVHHALREMIDIAAAKGWGDYRTAPVFQDAVMNTYSFNNHALRRFGETLKDAIDPNGILAPGRGGIWPDDYRGYRKL